MESLVANHQPPFSAGLVVTIVAVVFACVFGLTVLHGEHMTEHSQHAAQSS